MNESLAEKVLLAAVGPLTAAVVGSLIVGLLVSSITRAFQDRRLQYDLRLQLIDQMTESTSALTFAMAHYRRAREGQFGTEVGVTEIAALLHEQYRKTRTATSVLESRLETYFRSDLPRRSFHAAVDLLSVRYYMLLGQATEELLLANAGERHSGLTVSQLGDLDVVWTAYRQTMRRATTAVLDEPMSTPPSGPIA